MTRKIGADAFEFYVALGPNRSHKAVADRYDVTKRAVTKRASKEGWANRLEEIERKAREKSDEKLVDHLEEMRDRHLKTVRYMQGRALTALREYPLGSGMEAMRAAELSIKLERLIVGEPSERTSVDIEAVTKREMDRWLSPPEEEGDAEEASA